MTTLTNFLDQWQKDAIQAAYGKAAVKVVNLPMHPTDRPGIYEGTITPEMTEGATEVSVNMLDPTWCPVCETRETRKAFAPYCSLICKEAAERRELMDRR